MSKKVTLKPSIISSTENIQMECSNCKSKASSIPYICSSGHVICKTCQGSDTTMKDSHEGGDSNLKVQFRPDDDIKQLQIINSDIKGTDLASGDHENEQAADGVNDEEKKCCKEDIDNTLLIYKDLYLKNTIKTTVEYKNLHFQESKSTITPNIDDCPKITKKNEEEEVDGCNIYPRPVACPVTVCSKMVTIDSIMLHFIFDHSKVPRTTLEYTTLQEVPLKFANFSTEIQCVATFIMETGPRQIIKTKMESTYLKKGNKLLLLLTIRLPTNSVKLTNGQSPLAGKNNEPYTETSTGQDSKNGSGNKSCTTKSLLEEDEVFLLWLCKLDDEPRLFTITILGEDKRRGYCYIGDATHVRDKQDPSLLYERSECLIVKGSAFRRLFDNKGQITTLVSIIGCSK